MALKGRDVIGIIENDQEKCLLIYCLQSSM